jgi:hypothetical protein
VEISVITWLKKKSLIKFIHMTQNEHYQGWNGIRMTGILEMVMNLLLIQRSGCIFVGVDSGNSLLQ